MNARPTADVLAEKRLFATLDTRTRRWQLPGWGPVLLSDTVGFVRDLPHNLVASFKATLEEAVHADLLLHVLDVSHPRAQQQFDSDVEHRSEEHTSELQSHVNLVCRLLLEKKKKKKTTKKL